MRTSGEEKWSFAIFTNCFVGQRTVRSPLGLQTCARDVLEKTDQDLGNVRTCRHLGDIQSWPGKFGTIFLPDGGRG